MVYNMNVGSVKFRRNGEKSQNTERIERIERMQQQEYFSRVYFS